jgi:hypothetical protein
VGNSSVIDSMTYLDLIGHQNANIKRIRGIFWDKYRTDNNDVIKTLLDTKTKSSDSDQIRAINSQINFMHALLLMKDKLKIYVKSKSELEAFLNDNEPVLFEYHKRLKDDDFNVHRRKTYDKQFVNVLYGVQIRSAAKSLIYKEFEYCDKNEIKNFYFNTDSMLIKERDLNQMNMFLPKERGNFKIECMHNKDRAIDSQGKFAFRCNDKANN